MKNLISFLIIISVIFISSCSSFSNFSQHSPTVSTDGETLIYQTNFFSKEKYKLVVKYKTAIGWTPPWIMLDVNSIANDGAPFITYDNNNLILSSTRKGGKGSIDLWISHRFGPFWSIPENMGSTINSKGYDGFGSLSPDGKTLYFVRECFNKKKYNGDQFCIYSSRKKNNKWQKPKKLPSPINSKYSEFGPVILADSTTLIFSSARPGGFGGYDLYKVERLNNNRWTKAVNLGKSINTKSDDRLISIPASGEIMYYSKFQKNGTYKIESQPIPKKLQHTEVATISGTIMDIDDEDIKLYSKITITDIKNDKEPLEIESNKKDGKYIVILNKGKIYDISISCLGYTFYSKKIDLSKLKKFRKITQDIKLEKIKVGSKIILHKMYFKSNRYNLLNESKYELRRVIRLMNDNPGLRIEVGGHTGSIGTEKEEMKLSLDRSNEVKKYLIKHGIRKNRLTTRGYGTTQPIFKEPRKGMTKSNRRVELIVLEI